MNYQILWLRPLDSGGYGDLFLGRRSDNGHLVVGKYLRDYHLEHNRKAFEREVRILTTGLPGLITLLYWNTTAEPPYYVMPYLAGGSLTKYSGRLTDIQLQVIAIEVANTLAALHTRYIKNGDVKPDNILVADDGRLKLADPLGSGVGCTMFFSEHHGGTPGYWAPEVQRGGPISYAGDVYSYGTTLYHLLTGRKPKDGQRLDPPSEGYVTAPKIRELITACCQASPNARPSMQEVLRMLRGEQWSDIQATRMQKRQLLAACVLGGIVLLGAAVTA
jgi:serine/threonine protein kinase